MARPYTPLKRILRRSRARERRAELASQPAFTTEEEMRSKVTLTEAEMKAWNQIAAGKPMRNSTSVLQAIKMKMEFTMSKPVQKVETNQQVHIEVVNLGIPPDVSPPYNPSSYAPLPNSTTNTIDVTRPEIVATPPKITRKAEVQVASIAVPETAPLPPPDPETNDAQ